MDNVSPVFADLLEAIAVKVRNKEPLKMFVYLEDEEDAFSVPYVRIQKDSCSEEAFDDLMITEQIEMLYRLARNLECSTLFQVVMERIDLEDSGELENLVTYH